MPKKDIETFYPADKEAWREWLQINHKKKLHIWVIFYKKSSKKPSMTWSEAVDEALCFGWIDSTKRTLGDERYMQYFSRRKPNSIWSKTNKDKVAYLIAHELMAQAGLETITIAKQNGTWTLMDDVENLIEPNDLKQEFETNPNARSFYSSLSKSKRKQILGWITLAKRPETRRTRINDVIQSANQGELPKPLG